MMRFVHADLRKGAAADLAAHHERDDARQVALEREYLQVEHERRVIFERGGDARRLLDDGNRAGTLALGVLNPPFDVPNGVGELRQLGSIPWAYALLQPAQLVVHRVQQAAVLPDARD